MGRRGDFGGDAVIDAHDIDLLAEQLRFPIPDTVFDLNGDSQVDLTDLDILVTKILNTRYGDTDLNGTVDQLDFQSLASNFGSPIATWGRGDTDGDADIDFRDFVRLSNNFGFQDER